MIEQVRADLRALDGASADSLRRALPAHRQLVANMIAEMNREMRDMRMQADAPWTATVDSLRQDLTRMPDLGGGELAAVMPAHRVRVERRKPGACCRRAHGAVRSLGSVGRRRDDRCLSCRGARLLL